MPRYRFRPSPASARVLLTGEPYISNDASARPALRAVGPRARRALDPDRAPVRRGNRILGLLYAVNRPGGFTEDHAQTLLALAGRRGRSRSRTSGSTPMEREQRVFNESLREVSRAIVTTPSEDAALGRRPGPDVARGALPGGRRPWSLDGRRGCASPRRAAAITISSWTSPTSASLRQLLDRSARRACSPTRRQLCRRSACAASGGPALVAPLLAQAARRWAPSSWPSTPSTGPGPAEMPAGLAPSPITWRCSSRSGAVLRRERQARARASAVTRVTRLAVTRHEPESLLQAAAPELLALSGRRPRRPVPAPSPKPGADPGRRRRHAAGRGGPRARAAPRPGARARWRRSPERGSRAVPRRERAPPGIVTPHPDTRDAARPAAAVPRRGHGRGAVRRRRPRTASSIRGSIEFLHDVCQQVALGVDNARHVHGALADGVDRRADAALEPRRFTESFHVEMAAGPAHGAAVSLVMARRRPPEEDQRHATATPRATPRSATWPTCFRRGRRETDLAARLGGEEFALLLPGRPIASGARQGRRADPPRAGRVGRSPGVGSRDRFDRRRHGARMTSIDEDELLRLADERLYAAKSAGRNQVCYISMTVAPRLPRPGSPRKLVASSGYAWPRWNRP